MNSTKAALFTLIAAALLAPGLVRAEASMDPTVVGPTVYKKVFENDRIRANEITFTPGASIAMHSHPDHFVYGLSSGTLKVTGSDGKTMDIWIKPGDAIWLDAQSHSAVNPGKTEVKLIQVELKEPKPMKAMDSKPMDTKPAEKMPKK